jgi:hypothetical protein
MIISVGSDIEYWSFSQEANRVLSEAKELLSETKEKKGEGEVKQQQNKN